MDLVVPSSPTNLRQGELDAPHLSLVAETIFAHSLQLGVTGRWSEAPKDISRDELVLSGRGRRTDEQIRTLVELSVQCV
jgi:hypothetical protein